MKKRTRMWVSLIVILLLAAGAGAWGYAAWRRNQVFVATDDAYVKGPVVAVASRVPGSILTLEVTENQPVKAGQLLATLDPKDFEAMAAKARGSLAEARAAMALNRSQIAQAEAQVKAVESQKALADLEQRRLEVLVERQSAPRQKLDQARTAQQVAAALGPAQLPGRTQGVLAALLAAPHQTQGPGLLQGLPRARLEHRGDLEQAHFPGALLQVQAGGLVQIAQQDAAHE